MNEDIKKEIREIIHTYCGGNYENRRMATELILQKCQEKQLTLTDVIHWVAVSDKLPPRPDEDYLVCVRNKNKEGGIPIQDIGNFSSDGVWIKQNTWEDVVFWAELPKPPCL